MFIKTKYLVLLTIIAALLLIAAQCGAAQPAAEAPAAVEESPAETEEQAGEEEHAEEHEHEAEEHEHEAEEHEHEAEEHEHEADELAPVGLAEAEKLQVIATTSIVADIVQQVGGDLIDLTLLLPVGTDPHTFEPTPRDLANVADAHLLLANGMGLEEFLTEMIENAGGEAAVVHVSQGITARQFEAGDAHEHEGEEHEHEGEEAEPEGEEHEHEGEEAEHEGEEAEHEGEEHHHHEGADPHTWTTPANAAVFVHNIEQALGALDPANAASYAANAEAYAAELAELDAWVKAQIETIPAENRELVTDHTAFGYYADRYGLEQIGAVIPSFSTAAEPSAKELAELEDAISAYGVKAIFVGSTVNPALSERVAQDSGVRLLTLYTGSLGPAGSGVESYVDYIKTNTNTIVAGLK